MKSRLSKTAEKKTKKQLYLSILGIIIVLFVLIKFGIPALVNFSLFLSNLKNPTTATNTNNAKAVILPPTLNQPFSATNSATIQVSGTAAPKQTIQLYVNSELIDTTPTNSDGTFSFPSVNLTQQQNTIQTKAIQDSLTSDFSDGWTVSYIQKAPNLSVDSPSDGQTFPHDQSSIVVKGKTDPDIKVTVNDFWAIVDANGNYSYSLALQNGDNHITVVATDAAGNTTKKELTVHYSQ